jgi:hypothetical protein
MKLVADANRARLAVDEAHRQEWIEPHLWSEYMGEDGRRLYHSFTDEELLNILRLAAEELGHAPSQKEVFCVYRSFIRRRFANWPAALRTAGLKAPKRKWSHTNEQD